MQECRLAECWWVSETPVPRGSRIHPSAVTFEHMSEGRTDGNRPPAALGLWRYEITRGIVLRHLEGGAGKVDALPTQRGSRRSSCRSEPQPPQRSHRVRSAQ